MNRPTSLSELVDMPLGAAVFDSYDGIPHWMRGLEWVRVKVTHEAARTLIEAAGRKDLTSTIAYLVSKDHQLAVMAATFNTSGWIYTIEY